MEDREHVLDHSLVSGIAWTGAVKWATQLVSWTATIVVARLLSPDDYGLFGMAMVYVGVVQIIAEAGLVNAIVQRPDLTEREVEGLGGAALLLGAALAVLTLVVAVPLAMFYRTEAVRVIVSVLSLQFIVRSAQVVPRGLMVRELAFRRLAVIDGLEALALMAVTLALAALGWRAWALVIGTVASSAVSTVATLAVRRPRVRLPSWQLREPLRTAWHVMAAQVAWYAYSNADFAVIGRVLGSQALGAYTFAWNIASIPVERVSAMVGRVTPAVFAATQHDQRALRRYVVLLTEGLALATFPLCAGLVLVADLFVTVVLGPQWAGAAAPLRALSVYAAVRSVLYLTPQVLVSIGRSQLSLQFSLIALAVLPFVFLFATRWGATGVALAWVVAYPVLALSTFARATLRATRLSWGRYLAAMLPALRATAVMSAIVLVARLLLPDSWSLARQLVLLIVVGTVAYVAAVLLSMPQRLRAVAFRLHERTTPRHMHGPEHVTGSHRLLLISSHFPPIASVGALRWQKLVPLAAERGWAFDVVTMAPSARQAVDPARLEDLPPGTRVYGVSMPVLRVERVAAALWRVGDRLRRGAPSPVAGTGSVASDAVRWWPLTPRTVARAYAAWLDAARGAAWAREAARVALSLQRSGVHRAVITSGPPHTAHLAGATVNRYTGLPHVADLRDPWSLVQRLPAALASPVGRHLARRHERRVVAEASLVIANTEPLRVALSAAYPDAAHRMLAVTNGIDDDPLPSPQRSDCFRIVYAGTVYLDRDPSALFQAVRIVALEFALDPRSLRVEFLGVDDGCDGAGVDALAHRAGVAEFVHVLPMRPRRETLEFLASASMLVVLPQDSDLAIPAKIFEYLRFEAWLLVLGDPDGPVAQLLRGSGADVMPPRDVAAIAQLLRRRIIQHRSGCRPPPLTPDATLSRRAQAGRLFDAIESIIGPAPGPRDSSICAAS